MVRVEPRKTPRLMLNAVPLNIDDHDFVSEELNCVPYSRFLIMYDITEVGVLVNNDRIRIQVQFRQLNGVLWRTLYNGPFGALFEEQSTTPCNISVDGPCTGEEMRIVVTTDYTNADPSANHFVITAQIVLME